MNPTPISPPYHDRILTDPQAFMTELSAASVRAEDRFWVQAMTFEGDAAGEALIRQLIESPARDRRLCIDSYSKVVVNDTFVFHPGAMLSSAFRSECRNRDQLIEQARKAGVQVRYTNPVGPLMLRYPFRNHKKRVMVDDAAWIGGLNFSDHNFAWRDMMVRLDHPALMDAMRIDFATNWNGHRTEGLIRTPSEDLYFLDRRHFRGRVAGGAEPGHAAMYEALFGVLDAASQEILVWSPYLSWPLMPVLSRIHRSGKARVRVVSPADNNKPMFRKALERAARRGDIELTLDPGPMSHLKAILVDRSSLLFGSSNYDGVSYLFEEEIVAHSREQALVDEFIWKIAATSIDVRPQPN